MKKLDRRIARTRRALGEALISLTKEKGYEQITIRDLTQRADVGYATFYRHYKSKDELLREYMRGIIGEIRGEVWPQKTQYDEALALYQVISKHEDAIMFSTGLPRNHPAVFPLWEEAKEVVLSYYDARDESTIPLEVAVNHIINSVVDLFRWWFEDGQDYTPEQMAVMQSELIVKVTETVALDHRTKPTRVETEREVEASV